MRDRAEELQRVRVIGIGGEDLAIDRLGVGESSRAMQRDRLLKWVDVGVVLQRLLRCGQLMRG